MKKSYYLYILGIIFFFCGAILLSSCSDVLDSNNPTDSTIEINNGEEKYSVIFDSNGGTSVSPQSVKKGDKAVKPANPQKEGYSFENWYYEDEVWSFIGYSITEDITLTAHWIINEYEVELSKSISNAGEVNGAGNFTFDTNVTVTATTNPGYTFVGWFSDSKKISDNLTYSFKMPAKKMFIEAKWIQVSIGVNNSQAGKVSGLDSVYTVGDEVTITATTNPGYTFVGWYDGENLLSKEHSYSFKMPSTSQYYEARYSKVTLQVDYSNAGTVSELTGRYIPGDEVTITATTNPGYTFVGWFYNRTKVSDDLQYTFKISEKNETYVARWIQVEFSSNKPQGGKKVVLDGTYKVGDEVTVYANVNTGYIFEGWSLRGELVSNTTKLTFVMPDENIIYYALYSQAEYSLTIVNHSIEIEIDSTLYNGKYKYNDEVNISVCNNSEMATLWMIDGNAVFVGDTYKFRMLPKETTIDIYAKSLYSRDLNSIYFGSYPQSLVEDENVIDMLNTKIEGVPNSEDSNNWIAYDYYIENEIRQFMYYIDLDIDEDGMNDYRGVYFTQYRPTVPAGKEQSLQDDNGYLVNTLYWFKYEPVEWDILEEDDNQIIIISHFILDSQSYFWSDVKGIQVHKENPFAHANNYIYSDIRRFLNEDFYNTTFNDVEKLMIKTSVVDNGEGYVTGTSCYNDTYDKIYLLSSQEANNYFSEKEDALTTGTDYALCQGLYVFKENAYWWLRKQDETIYTAAVLDTGVYTMIPVNYTYYGVRMALCILK